MSLRMEKIVTGGVIMFSMFMWWFVVGALIAQIGTPSDTWLNIKLPLLGHAVVGSITFAGYKKWIENYFAK